MSISKVKSLAGSNVYGIKCAAWFKGMRFVHSWYYSYKERVKEGLECCFTLHCLLNWLLSFMLSCCESWVNSRSNQRLWVTEDEIDTIEFICVVLEPLSWVSFWWFIFLGYICWVNFLGFFLRFSLWVICWLSSRVPSWILFLGIFYFLSS